MVALHHHHHEPQRRLHPHGSSAIPLRFVVASMMFSTLCFLIPYRWYIMAKSLDSFNAAISIAQDNAANGKANRQRKLKREGDWEYYWVDVDEDGNEHEVVKVQENADDEEEEEEEESGIAIQESLKEPLVVMVQGKFHRFEEWCDRVVHQSSDNAVLIFGAYDEKPPPSSMSSNLKCQAIHIPNTTWTEGRNELSKAAYCREQQRQKDFKYWIFSDDDIDINCRPIRQAMRRQKKRGWNKVSCWEIYFEFVNSGLPKFNVPLLVADFHKVEAYDMVDFFDSALNAMERDRIHLMLPYIAREQEGSSWWISSMVQILMSRGCFPNLTMTFELAISNPVHSEYPRGLPFDEANAVLKKVIHPYVPDFRGFPPNSTIYHDMVHRTQMTNDQVIEFEKTQMKQVGNYCDPLKKRWDDWLASWGPTCSAYSPNSTMPLSITAR